MRSKFLFVLLSVALVVSLGIALGLFLWLRPAETPPPLLGTLPEFELVDQNGAPFGRDRMEGRVHVANFIFTLCPDVCPRLSERMAELQDRLGKHGDGVRLLSFSVDPRNDTPEVLRAYGERFGADFRRWTFLTGSLEAIEGAVVEGFKVAVQRTEIEGGFMGIVHGEQFVLVDQHARIRGYFAADERGMKQLVKKVQHLVERGPGAPGESETMVDY